jgi:2-polyprenyl-6-methoxyphenol hydroxylase-like FAD-dependent oxidoreductase
MVDAAVLAQELATGAPVQAALARYERRRRSAVTPLQRVAEGLAWLGGLRRAGPVLVRDALLGTTRRVPRLLERQIRDAQQEEPVELRRWTSALSQPT